MKSWVIAAAALATLRLVAPAAAQTMPILTQKPAHPCAKLETALPHGIALLEAERYKEFLEAFCVPAELKQALRGQTLDEFAKSFGEGGDADVLLRVLKSIRTQEPVMSDEGTVATYRVTEKDAPRNTIEFTLIEGRWYINN